jgi:hypothetical protein
VDTPGYKANPVEAIYLLSRSSLEHNCDARTSVCRIQMKKGPSETRNNQEVATNLRASNLITCLRLH